MNQINHMKNISKTLIVIAASLAAQTAVIAQTRSGDSGSGFYIGGAYGKSSIKPESGFFAAHPAGTQDTSDRGYKFLGGYQLSENFAAEVQYQNLGEFSFNQPGVGSMTIKTQGISLAGVGMLPISNGFSLLGKLGLTRQTYKEHVIDVPTGLQATRSANQFSPLIGFGAEYAITEGLRLRAEYEYFGKPKVGGSGVYGDTKVASSLISVGMRYRF